MKHVELAAAIESALVVLIDALEGVLDACEVGNASVHSLQQFHHRQESPIEGRYVIEIEGQVRSTASNLFAVLHQFFYASYLGEWRCHSTYAPCAYLLGMFGQSAALAHTATADMYNHLEAFGCCLHPGFGYLHAFVTRQHVAFARRTVDKHAFQSVLCQHLGILWNRFQVHVTISLEWCKRGIDEALNLFKLFHLYILLNIEH